MKRILALIGLFLFIPILHAQDIPATYGEPVTLNINSDLPQIITFEGAAGDVVAVSQFSDAVNIPLTLYGADGALLSESFNLERFIIPPVTLPAAGTYRLSVQRPDYDDATGDMQILINGVAALPSLTEDSVSGSYIMPGDVRWFTYEAAAGDLYRMQANCEQCSLFALLPNGDVRGLTYSTADPVWLLDQWPVSGRVLIGSATAVESDYRALVETVTPIPLTSGTPSEGTLGSGQYKTFVFDSSAGKAWRLDALLSGQGDRVLRVFQFAGREAWETMVQIDTGSGPDGNPQITPFIAPADATYYVVVEWRGFRDDSETTPYTVSLRPETLRQLVPDGSVTEGQITGQDGASRYLYRGTAGETLTVTLTKRGSSGQPSIQIIGPQDEAMTFTGRAAVRLSVDVILPVDGWYQVAVTNIDYDTTTTLDYALTLAETEK